MRRLLNHKSMIYMNWSVTELNNLVYNIKTILTLDWEGRDIQMKNFDDSNIYYQAGIVGELKHLNRGKAANQPLLSTLWAARLLSTRSGKHLILFANYFMQMI